MMATKAELQAAIKKYGTQRKAAEALGIGRATIYDILNGRNTGVGKGGGRHKAAGAVAKAKPAASSATAVIKTTSIGGYSLKSVRSSRNKPQESCRARFFELESGKAYLLDDVAREWNVSAETLRKHAKHLAAFIYIEVSEENWQPAVTRPKTKGL